MGGELSNELNAEQKKLDEYKERQKTLLQQLEKKEFMKGTQTAGTAKSFILHQKQNVQDIVKTLGEIFKAATGGAGVLIQAVAFQVINLQKIVSTGSRITDFKAYPVATMTGLNMCYLHFCMECIQVKKGKSFQKLTICIVAQKSVQPPTAPTYFDLGCLISASSLDVSEAKKVQNQLWDNIILSKQPSEMQLILEKQKLLKQIQAARNKN